MKLAYLVYQQYNPYERALEAVCLSFDDANTVADLIDAGIKHESDGGAVIWSAPVNEMLTMQNSNLLRGEEFIRKY